MKLATHAGTVVYRDRGDGFEYLLVSAQRNPGQWVLPKGHIESGETPEETAVRETREEAGVSCVVIDRIDRSTFDQRGVVARVDFFLARFKKDVEPEESRKVRWYPYKKASERLAYDNLKDILRRAKKMLAGGADDD